MLLKGRKEGLVRGTCEDGWKSEVCVSAVGRGVVFGGERRGRAVVFFF